MMNLLDRSGTEPLHVQLKRALLAEIREQRLRPGDRLATELEIEARYGVSRATVREAISGLISAGLVQRIQGKGTFLTSPGVSHVPRLTSFTQNMLSQGHVPSLRMLDSARVEAPLSVPLVRDEDGFGGMCRFLRRLLLADARPIGVSNTWIPLSVLGGDDSPLETLGGRSLYAALQEAPISLQLHKGFEDIQAEASDSETARLLDCAVGDALLVAERSAYLADGRMAEFTRMKFVGSRYVYRVNLTPEPIASSIRTHAYTNTSPLPSTS